MNTRDREVFAPLWRRLLGAVLLGAWIAYETANGNIVWAMISGAAFGWWIWSFFLTWAPMEDGD